MRVQSRWGDLCSWRLGSGPAVMLVHGWQDDNSLWSPLIDELDRRGRALVAFDLPGHGASGGDWGVSSRGPTPSSRSPTRWGRSTRLSRTRRDAAWLSRRYSKAGQSNARRSLRRPSSKATGGDATPTGSGWNDDVVLAAKAAYFDRVGPDRAAWGPRTASRRIDIDLLVVHSRDDEHNPVRDTEEIIPRSCVHNSNSSTV